MAIAFLLQRLRLCSQQERHKQLINKLKDDFGHIPRVRSILADAENKNGIYAKMDLKGINNQLEQLASAMERASPKQYVGDKGQDSQPPASHPHSCGMKKELQQTIEHIKGMQTGIEIEQGECKKFSA